MHTLYGDGHYELMAKATQGLSNLIKSIVQAGITTKKEYKAWARENESLLKKAFWFPEDEALPPIHSLVSAFFHPELPLIGLNYTPVAHNVLHAIPQGWTLPLRVCRGVIFDREANLVALPFLKFYNLGENPETALDNLPTGMAFEASEKMDGHLGIIFNYDGQWLMTTRGSFLSSTGKLGCEMIKKISVLKGWDKHPELNRITLLTEFIHPETRVHVQYNADEDGFVLIGANNLDTLHDYDYNELLFLGKIADLSVTKLWQGSSLNNLVELMKDRSVQNREGFVIRFANGLRVKVKFETYIGLMVKAKLTYTYLMNRMISGNLERMLATLDEEIRDIAMIMLGRIMMGLATQGTNRQKWTKLYNLVDLDDATSYFKQICRTFVKHMRG
jgi:hypothetical protein